MARPSRWPFSTAVLAVLAALALAAVPGAAAARGLLYRLEPESTATHGCLPPCLCPAVISDDLRGTFELWRVEAPFVVPLQPVLPDGEIFQIRNVNWMVTLGGEEVHVTGFGTYTRAPWVPLERLELVLTIGDEAPRRFFGSGDASAPFPVIDIDVSEGQLCLGTLFRLRAAPVPRAERLRYRLDDTTFTEGCLPPCQCVLSQAARVVGRLSLVDVTPARDGSEFAVVGVRWRLRPIYPISGLSLPRRIHGFGFYRIEPGPTLPREHSMLLRLHLGRDEPTTFESGVMSTSGLFPRLLEIGLARNGFACFDQVIDLRARQRLRRPAR